MMGSSMPATPFPSHPQWFPKVDPKPINIATTATCLHIGFFLNSSFKKLSFVCHVPRLKDVLCENASQLKGLNFLKNSNIAFASLFSYSASFFSEGENKKGFGNEGKSSWNTSRGGSSNGPQWTYILLGINVLVFIAQVATRGKLLLWGAKINSLIDKGQFWRLATSSLLHANIGHLMINCYSLNSVGPAVESLTGPRRFLAVYLTSAIASSAVSYWFCKAPAVGASGAIFGLVGSLAMFIIRHRGMIRGGKEELQHIARVILLNMAIGFLSKGIDNWGHLGGLVGGVATSWFVGPAWKYESLTKDGRQVFVDKAPIKYFSSNRSRGPHHLP